jgi:hypothetical protein
MMPQSLVMILIVLKLKIIYLRRLYAYILIWRTLIMMNWR